MEDIRIFDGIGETEVRRMMTCFGAARRRYSPDSEVLHYSGMQGPVCVVLSGRVDVECLDADGNVSVVEMLEKDSVFGELFLPPIEPLVYTAVARANSEVLFIDYSHIVCPCENVCAHHSQLINNLFMISARKVRGLSKRISLLSRRSLRQKLLLYLEYIAAEAGTDAFEIPVSLSRLADYLSADRSAMMRELGQLKSEGILWSKGRSFRLLRPEMVFEGLNETIGKLD